VAGEWAVFLPAHSGDIGETPPFGAISLIQVEWSCAWPLILPYFEGSVPAGFPSPAEDHLETPLDLSEYLIENRAATFMMRVEGDLMCDAGILNGDLLVVDRSAKPVNGSVVVVAVMVSTR
jgi:hypothetical protein